MRLSDIVPKIQALLDDPDGTYIDDNYVASHAQLQYEALYNKIYNTGSQSVEQSIELLAIAASTADLSAYQATGQSLATLVTPTVVEWKLSGQDKSFYRYADGPLDKVRDIPVPGLANLDCWAWIRRNIQLSLFNTALDIRVTGKFLFSPLTSTDVSIDLLGTGDLALAYMIALSIAEARGNPGWIQRYEVKSQDAIDEFLIALTKAEQSKTRRFGRLNRRSSTTGNTINIHS
jgi:hypothetical protein